MEIKKTVHFGSGEAPKKSTRPLPTWAAILIVVVVIAGFLFFPRMEHIEDTNGADNFALATLTDADILARTLTCTGGPNRTMGHLDLPGGWSISAGVELSARKFSGVADILWANYIIPSDFTLSLDHFSVTEGNFRMMVINEGKIIAEIQPGDNVDVLIEDITGNTTVRIAGESAAFTIAMTEFQYDLFEHE